MIIINIQYNTLQYLDLHRYKVRSDNHNYTNIKYFNLANLYYYFIQQTIFLLIYHFINL